MKPSHLAFLTLQIWLANVYTASTVGLIVMGCLWVLFEILEWRDP